MAGGETRRNILAASLLGGAALASVGAEAAASTLPDLDTPAGRFRAYMLMRGALDGQLVIGFVSGRYYGVVDGEITPLYGVAGATFSRYRLRPDGGYDGVGYELAFFTDLATGVALDEFHNPYTGETVPVPVTALPPGDLIITPGLDVITPKAPPGFAGHDRVVSSQVTGSDVWFTEETTASFTLPGAAKPFHYNEMLTIHGNRGDLEAPGVTHVRATTAYTSVVTWRPWLKMGDRPGHLTAAGAGRYGATMEDLPANWRAAAAKHRPDILENPAALLKDELEG
jgi:hypothetical protein